MSRQVKLMQLTTNYSKKMNQLKNRIFGDLVRPTSITSMKVVNLMSEMPVHKNPEKTVEYYPRHLETHALMTKLRDYGLYRDEHKDFQEEMTRLRELRGKRIWWKENNKK
ncbi:28S ribosomal protein S33, mitochondrial [Cimex lectularius]|uniref:Small ribosomal subunit protein mS33 n=1 Tax=Cimex lectularius TaxID=79782 RepID=A0A8I6RZ82_CIMLE|nr:28S ribosomal protein S33, mitochondrial [Cimex lectularius]